MNKFIGFIPARSGSKGVPNKNFLQLGNKRLIEWSVVSAEASKLDSVVISTDSDEFLNNYSFSDKIKGDRRDSLLAADDTPTVSVIIEYGLRNNLSPSDVIILLQPTCPFRSAATINQCIELFQTGKFKSIVSVADVEGNHPFRMKRIENGLLVNFIDQGFEDMKPRQLLPSVYIRSGTIYAAAFGDIVKSKSMVPPGPSCPLILEGSEIINIDSYVDFKLAESFLSHDG